MNEHLHSALRMAWAGAAVGSFGLASGVVNVLRGREQDWRTALIAAAAFPLMFAVAGFLYSVLLPRLAGQDGTSLPLARLFSGMVAGAVTMGLFISPYLLVEVAPGAITHAGMLFGAMALGAVAGMSGGLLLPLWRPDALARTRAEPAGPHAPLPGEEPHPPA